MQDSTDRAIAIVGISAILPDAPDAATFWNNIAEGRYSISEVPQGRWDPQLYYDADPKAADKTYSKIGGWVREWNWDPYTWHLPIPPKIADAMDDAQKWAVACAHAALADYGVDSRPLDRERTAVILGNAMGGELHYLTSLRVLYPEIRGALERAPAFGELPVEVRARLEQELHAEMDKGLPAITEDTMPGELSNCMAGRIANLFDFHGPNYVCDAACASALAAMDAAVEGLITREFDAALVGGVDRNMGANSFVKFCKIGALSATGTRPYADGADGFVMGEGAAFFLLKRLADAEANGDRIYAVLRGIGGSSDGRGKGITAPNPIGQRLAIQRAWRSAGLAPQTATLVEGHGTSTRVGDVVEVESLNAEFGGEGVLPGSIALGSVKSNIGHLKSGAGAAGMLKAVLALHHKQLPPSLNFKQPNPNIDFSSSPFAVNSELRCWDKPANGDGIRRAGVSAFGFGGTNFHAVLEEYIPGRLAAARTPATTGAGIATPGHGAATRVAGKVPLEGILVLGAADPQALQQRLEEVLCNTRALVDAGPSLPDEVDLQAAQRIAIAYASGEELKTRGQRAMQAFAANQASIWKALQTQGVFRGSGAAPKVAFLFTGQGSQYANMLRELREREPIVGQVFAEADAVMTELLGRPLSDYIFVDPDDAAAVAEAEAELRKTEITQPAVLAVDNALTQLFGAYGVVPDMVMGHSLGEYGALVAADAMPFAQALETVSARGREMARVSCEDNGLMAAVFAPLEQIQAVVDSVAGNVVIANINSTSQAVIGGATAAVQEAVARLEKDAVNVVMLPVSQAFHTTIVAPASEPLREVLQRMTLAVPRIPLVANVTGEFYSQDPAQAGEMVDVLARQVASPVQFLKGLHTLYDAGARVFIEVGPKKALQGFADDVLGQHADVLTLSSNHPKLGAARSFNQALAGLYAAGLGVGRQQTSAVLESSPPALPATAAATVAAGTVPALQGGEEGYRQLGHLVADLVSRHRPAGPGAAPALAAPVVSGAALGLPGTPRVFDEHNVGRILSGEQEIDVIPTRFRKAIVAKHITRLVKEGGGEPHFETIDSASDVIKLAGRGGGFDLNEEYGVPKERVEAYDITTSLAIAAGIDALRDAGVPLVMHYRKTTKGTLIPTRWMLPESMRDDTGIIFASCFPGIDAFADELTRYQQEHDRELELETLERLRARFASAGGTVQQELDREIHELQQLLENEPYDFDRRFLFRVLAMGHSQMAEYIGARGPNTQINSACASSTQSFAMAEDWIRAGRCRRVLVIAADDVTSDHLLEWIGAGFLASGAAATDEDVSKAALPFDRRRHGMIMGMGACGIVLESPECVAERGMRPICEVLSTTTANSAFHGTRLDIEHICQVMESVVSQAESRFGIDREQIAGEMMFMSHETYTPARGGSAAAEVHALRQTFGAAADKIVIANTKGYTGHAMGVGIEDTVAIKALETGIIPPLANFQEEDPELGPLNLSQGGVYPVRYALRLAAGFGSQISMSLMRLCEPPDGLRPGPDQLGYESRLTDSARFGEWLQTVSGEPTPQLEVVQRTLRVKVSGAIMKAGAAVTPLAVTSQPVTSPPAAPQPATPQPAAPQHVAAEEPVAAAAAASPAPVEDAVTAKVLEIVAGITGYPPEMLDLDLDLEADLGIDTVKQAETFAAIRGEWDIPRDENLQLRDYPTIAHAVSFVRERASLHEPAAVASAPAAAAAAPAAASPAPAEDEVTAKVLEIVSGITGYPPEMLDLDLDLEADLGIDTVKQAETFAAIRGEWDIPRDENLQLRDYPTIAHAVSFVRERASLPEPAAVAPAPAAASPAPAEDEVTAKVLEIVSGITGYPPEMLDLDLDLEADLGIDTVKQAETFAAIRGEWDIPRDENLQLRDYPTIAHAIGFVHERAPAGITVAEPSAALVAEAASAQSALPSQVAGNMEASAALPRRSPRAVLRPALELCKETGVALGEGSRVIVMPDTGGVGAALVQRLRKRGVAVLELDHDTSREQLGEQIGNWQQDGPINGLYWLPALDSEDNSPDLGQWRQQLELRVKLFHAAARALYDDLGQPSGFLISATRLGGRHGYDEAGALFPMGGAVTGFTKAFAREQDSTLVKAVDFGASRKTAALADVLIEETLRDPGAVEVGHADGFRWTVSLWELGPDAVGKGMSLDGDKVFVITGAAGSIVSAITADLADASAGTFYLLDLAPEPDPENTDIRRVVTDRDALKRDIFERLRESGERATPALVEKQVAVLERANAALTAIESVRAAGGSAVYCQLDLTDADATAGVIASVRSQHGRIDVLLHAAGLEISHPLPDKSAQEFDLVFDVKCDGWFNLIHAIGDMPLGAAVVFSSIAGRFGNLGQTDYSAANDLLCKSISAMRTTHPQTRGLALDWTAWADIGMASRGSIPQIMAAAGIDMLAPEAGIPVIRRELSAGDSRGELVVAQRLGILYEERDDTGGLDPAALAGAGTAPMLGQVKAMSVGRGLEVETELDPARQPFLYDHKIEGTAVLPGVMAIEAFSELGLLMFPGRALVAAENVQFLAPCKFYRDEPQTLLLSARFVLDGDDVLAHCRCLSSRRLHGQEEPRMTTHFLATVRLASTPSAAVTRVIADQDAAPALSAADLYRIYFHGPAYQVVGSSWRSPEGVVGAMAAELPDELEQSGGELVARPRLLELCFQTAGAWEIGSSGQMGLPYTIRRVSFFGGNGEQGSELRALAQRSDDSEQFDALVVDGSGHLRVSLEGYRTIAFPGTIDGELLAPLQELVR